MTPSENVVTASILEAMMVSRLSMAATSTKPGNSQGIQTSTTAASKAVSTLSKPISVVRTHSLRPT